MLKKIVFSVMLLGFFLVYQFRIEIIRSVINLYTVPLDLYVKDISGLQFGLDTVAIDKLTLFSAKHKNAQHLEKITVKFSVRERRIGRIEVQRLALAGGSEKYRAQVSSEQYPAKKIGSQSKGPLEPILLDEWLLILRDVPIDTFLIQQLEIAALDRSYRVLWTKEEAHQDLNISSGSQTVEVKMVWVDDGRFVVKFRAGNLFSKTFNVDVEIRPLGEGYTIDFDSQMFFEPTQTALVGRSRMAQQISSLTGGGNIHLQSKLKNDLRIFATEPLVLTFVEPFDLNFSINQEDLHASMQRVIPRALDRDWKGSGELQFSVRSGGPAQIFLDLSRDALMSVRADSLEFRIEEPAKNRRVEAQLSQVNCAYGDKLNCGFGFDLLLAAESAEHYSNAVLNFSSQLSGLIKVSETRLALTLNPGQIVSATSIVFGDLTISNSAVHLIDPLTAEYQFDVNKWDVDASHLTVNVPHSDGSEFSLSTIFDISSFELEKDTGLNVAFRVRAKSFNVKVADSWAPKLSLSSVFSLADEQVQVEGSLKSAADPFLLNFAVNHSLSTRSGEATLTSEGMNFGTAPLSSRFFKWPFNWDLNRGVFSHRSQFKWFNKAEVINWSGEGVIRLADVGGFYGDVAFFGLNTQFSGELDSLSSFTSIESTGLNMSLLDVGFPITDIGLKFKIEPLDQHLTIVALDANILGGHVSASDFSYVKGMNNLLSLQVEGLHIDKLVELAAYDALKASGIISGHLPISFAPEGISMDSGALAAELPGGIIQYTPKPGVSLDRVNPTVTLVSDALRNYHYQTMLATANYSNNGDLTLSMKMKGVSPDLNNGQKINLNLNVSDNIPTLLKSLQSSRVISEVLEKALLK